MPRKTATSVRVDPNIRAMRIYPVEETKKRVVDLKTVGIKLSREQTVRLATVLLAMAQEYDEAELTGHRFERGKDGTYPSTVASMA